MAMKKNQRYAKSEQLKRNKKEAQNSQLDRLEAVLGFPPRPWLIVLAICLVLVVATLGIRALIAPSAEPPLVVEASPQSPSPEKKMDRPAMPPRESSPAERETMASAEKVQQRVPALNDTTPGNESQGLVGIHVFPPLGTRPNLSGIIVPDDFELPPGYVRHYQTSDDGRQLEPILMYHPKRRPVDSQGDPIDVPPDRIVPPEMAPEGLPVRMLQLPETMN